MVQREKAEIAVLSPAPTANGAVTQSPGLARRAYPGKRIGEYPFQPQRGCGHGQTRGRAQPRWGWKIIRIRVPRVAQSEPDWPTSQPRAGGWNPVGIHRRFRQHLEVLV